MFSVSLLLLLLPIFLAEAFLSQHHSPSCSIPTALHISFGGSNTASNNEFPKDVKDAVSKCREAVQQALQQRQSRMDIEFPVGTKFGVEPVRKKNKRQQTNSDGPPTRQVLDTSNRELSRLFVDMFQPVGGENIAVVFTDSTLADQARNAWKGDTTAQCRILSLDNKKSSKKQKKKKPLGFAAKMEAEVGNTDESGPFAIPENIEVALFVAPSTQKELAVIERICDSVGQATLVVLLNARLASIEKFPAESETLFLQEFEPVFSLCAAPQSVAPGCLLHRSYPSDWLVARKPKIGTPKVIFNQKERPTEDDCKRAYDSIDVSDFEKNVEGLAENIAGWFS